VNPRAAFAVCFLLVVAPLYPLAKPAHRVTYDPPPQLMKNIMALLDACREFRIRPDLGFALTWQESNLNEKAIAKRWREIGGEMVLVTTARGMLQINPKYEAELVVRFLGWDPSNFDWSNPVHSARLGCAYLRWLIDRYGEWGGVCSYNAGWYRFEQLVKYGRRLPADTEDYYRKVLG